MNVFVVTFSTNEGNEIFHRPINAFFKLKEANQYVLSLPSFIRFSNQLSNVSYITVFECDTDWVDANEELLESDNAEIQLVELFAKNWNTLSGNCREVYNTLEDVR